MLPESLEAFSDEFSKIAEEEGVRRNRWAAPVGALGGAALAAAGIAASRPALRAHVAAEARGLGRKGGVFAAENAAALPIQVQDHARQVAEHLWSKGIDPSKARIAIAGTGGTGKSSLARGLAERLGMNVQSLDHQGQSFTGRDLGKYVAKNPIQPGTIAEQTHLLSQVSPHQFDATIHIEKPIEEIQKQILSRGRHAGQLDLYDYPKLQNTIGQAFKGAPGEPTMVVPGIHVKTSPVAAGAAIPSRKDNRKWENKVHKAVGNGRPMVGGVVPYVNKTNVGVGAGAIAGGATAGGMLGKRLAQPKQEEPSDPPKPL